MGYMLETRGLTKRFGRGDQAQDAVADVSLHIREGEVYGLLGPNGAGKSTTLKMICGMLRPTAGEILFAGHAWRREDLHGGRHYGLGLHVASEAASAHGGSVSLANSPSGGAVATIAVPLCGA